MGGEEELRGSEEELREPLLDEYELLDREEVEEAVQAVSPQQNRNKQTTEAPLSEAPPPALAIWQAVVAALLKAWLYGQGALGAHARQPRVRPGPRPRGPQHTACPRSAAARRCAAALAGLAAGVG